MDVTEPFSEQFRFPVLIGAVNERDAVDADTSFNIRVVDLGFTMLYETDGVAFGGSAETG